MLCTFECECVCMFGVCVSCVCVWQSTSIDTSSTLDFTHHLQNGGLEAAAGGPAFSHRRPGWGGPQPPAPVLLRACCPLSLPHSAIALALPQNQRVGERRLLRQRGRREPRADPSSGRRLQRGSRKQSPANLDQAPELCSKDPRCRRNSRSPSCHSWCKGGPGLSPSPNRWARWPCLPA